ncbi:MAG: cupin domain-containing protein [Candidatus Kariarchaeaceae archaeon]
MVKIEENIIQHFGIRAPNLADKNDSADLPVPLPPLQFASPRYLNMNWGFRIPLSETKYQNRCILGFGKALINTSHIILAYMEVNHREEYDKIDHVDQFHAHKNSWEYYIVLEGSDNLRIGDKKLSVNEGEILEVPPGICHTRISLDYPFKGLTIRVPLISEGDKYNC